MSEETELSQGTKPRILSNNQLNLQPKKLQELLNKAYEQPRFQEDSEEIEEDDFDDDYPETETDGEEKEIPSQEIQTPPLKLEKMSPVTIPFKSTEIETKIQEELEDNPVSPMRIHESKVKDLYDYIENSQLSFRRGTAILKIIEGDIRKAIELLQKEI